MTAWWTLRTVFAKELRDALRDRRTLMVVFITSIAIGPLLLVMLSTLIDKLEKRAEAREIVAIGLDHAPTLRNFLERQTYVVKSAPADWEAQLKENQLGDPVVVIPADFEDAIAHGDVPVVQVIYSSANGRAQNGVGRIEHLLQGLAQEHGALRLVARGVSPSLLNVLQVDEHDVADNAARAAQLTGILPFFVLMAMLYGALNAALDTTAGERERGSLEPLLATPAPRGAIVVGKWGAVLCVAVLIAVLSCLSFLPAQRLLRSESLAALFRFGWVEAAAFVAVLVPLGGALAATMMAVSIRCKTFKEAQASNSVVMLCVSLVPMISLFSQEGEAAWHRWVPGLAQTTLMNRVLKGTPIGWLDAAPGIFVCIAITVIALWIVSRQLVRRAAQ